MSTLDDLQARINKDKALKNAFLKDPVGTLRKEGIEVAPDSEQAVKDGVAKVVAKFKAARSAYVPVKGVGVKPTDVGGVNIKLGG